MGFRISWRKIAGDGKAYESHDRNKKKEPGFGLSWLFCKWTSLNPRLAFLDKKKPACFHASFLVAILSSLFSFYNKSGKLFSAGESIMSNDFVVQPTQSLSYVFISLFFFGKCFILSAQFF